MSVATGESSAGRQRRDPRLVAERGEVVDAGQAHHLPPGMLVPMGYRIPLALVVAAGVYFLRSRGTSA